jgi:hypothetical protein
MLLEERGACGENTIVIKKMCALPHGSASNAKSSTRRKAPTMCRGFSRTSSRTRLDHADAAARSRRAAGKREHLVRPRWTVMEPIVAIQLSERMAAALACWRFSRRHIPPIHEIFRLAFDASNGSHFPSPPPCVLNSTKGSQTSRFFGFSTA